eukprot:CAMPEP_0115352390 /NCGR_PEP_ID=MMETSP0270-20121206/97477_1 /TAXON_ID=71861 /ORGANISM="Scrippsiella trochoidea, Strain CCMP3099" /LENGTH=777 /DNA_ID=CAMNT_0002774553 /DNA_START=72 /DNA_END=2402 /DNA_ORIENTATION=+
MAVAQGCHYDTKRGHLMVRQADLQKELAGKVVVVTGAGGSIGLEVCRQLVRQGATVAMCGRSMARLTGQAESLSNLGGLAVPVHLDLCDLGSVRRAAGEILKRFPCIHCLVNNAGVMNMPLERTVDGFEPHLGANHLGHFLLTKLLVPRLLESKPARVINVSSYCHFKVVGGGRARIFFDDLNFESCPYDAWEAYSQSKLANVLHAQELAKRFGDEGLTAVSLHPGFVDTELFRHTFSSATQWFGRLAFKGFLSPWQGAQTTLHCILADRVVDHNAAYFSQANSPGGWPVGLMYGTKALQGGGWPMAEIPNTEAHDPETARRLWEMSEELVARRNAAPISRWRQALAQSAPAATDLEAQTTTDSQVEAGAARTLPALLSSVAPKDLRKTAAHANGIQPCSQPDSASGDEEMGLSRSRMPMRSRASSSGLKSLQQSQASTFPTLYVDLLSIVPFVFASVFFLITDEVKCRSSLVPQWTFEPRDYLPVITSDGYHCAAFGLYSLGVFICMLTVLYHACVRHHAKHYVTRANRISIIAHIIGGTTTIACLYAGLITGSKGCILVACIAGLVLHSPSTWWQQRNVYGHREVTLPAYTVMGVVMPLAFLNVIWEDASYETVFAAGMGMNVFAWVRALGLLSRCAGMSVQQMYDRAVVWAGLLLRALFNLVRPFSRLLLEHNFAYSITSDMRNAAGEGVEEVMDRLSDMYPGDRERQVAVAVYEVVKTGELLNCADLVSLFRSWGIVGYKELAMQVFEDADERNTGALTLDDFIDKFGFIYQP